MTKRRSDSSGRQTDRQTYSLSKIKKVKPKLNIIEQSGDRSTKVEKKYKQKSTESGQLPELVYRPRLMIYSPLIQL